KSENVKEYILYSFKKFLLPEADISSYWLVKTFTKLVRDGRYNRVTGSQQKVVTGTAGLDEDYTSHLDYDLVSYFIHSSSIFTDLFVKRKTIYGGYTPKSTEEPCLRDCTAAHLCSIAMLGHFSAPTLVSFSLTLSLFISENIEKFLEPSDFPGLDPPTRVVNTALSVMAYEYPTMEKNGITTRSPDEYFASNYSRTIEAEKIKVMYESMKFRKENVVETGRVDDEYITNDKDHQAFSKWRTDHGFTRQNHPSNSGFVGEKPRQRHHRPLFAKPGLCLYTEERLTSPHHFKADPEIRNRLAYIQFPQEFHGLNETDSYAGRLIRLFKLNPSGLDGLSGPNYMGTCCFIRRRSLFGDPLTLVSPEIRELSADYVVNNPITSPSVLEVAHRIGFRYGLLVEDFYTGFRLKCEGWRSIFCNPEKAAFTGNAPLNLLDVPFQNKRWQIGLLEVASSRYSPITFGVKAMGLFMGLGYSSYAYSSILSIPITTYSFVPQLALLNGLNIFPKVSEPWFLLYVLVFLGAYGQDFLEHCVGEGTIQRRWSDQRLWMIKGLSCFLFGLTEFLLKSIGIPTQGFNVTRKVIDDEQRKRYEQGLFEFGVSSAMFVPLTMAAIVNLFSFTYGLIHFVNGSNKETGLMPLLLSASFPLLKQLWYWLFIQ
ncbi:hypothetical protein Gotri_027311, partial [Gossypium trilobum]|nr:hypothetical protein [Gossypium trilobum]